MTARMQRIGAGAGACAIGAVFLFLMTTAADMAEGPAAAGRDPMLDVMGGAPASRVVIDWADPAFRRGDSVLMAPSWFVRAEAHGSDWRMLQSDAGGLDLWIAYLPATASFGVLSVAIDRAELPLGATLVVDITLIDLPGGSLYADLVDVDGRVVAADLVGNLVRGAGGVEERRLRIGLAAFPGASGLLLRHGGGNVAVITTALSVEEEAAEEGAATRLGADPSRPEAVGNLSRRGAQGSGGASVAPAAARTRSGEDDPDAEPVGALTAEATAALAAAAKSEAPGFLLYERWDGVESDMRPGALLTWPKFRAGQPDVRTLLPEFSSPSGVGENYGTRIRGYVRPPESGTYRFFIAGDDGAELYLSVDARPSRARLIAEVPAGHYTLPRQWAKYPEQESAPVTLSAGETYYIETLHVQGVGGDFVQVGWMRPGRGEIEIIGGAHLAAYVLDPHDADDDGFADGYEAADPRLNPMAADIGVRLHDYDGDFLTDGEELDLGLDPLVPGQKIETPGFLLCERWDGLPDGDDLRVLFEFPRFLEGAPDVRMYLRRFAVSMDVDVNFATRIRGLITAPESGAYQFFLAGDDGCVLFLSTTPRADRARQLAAVPFGGYTARSEWDRYAEQASAPVALEAGRQYFVEVWHRGGKGDDFVQVGWKRPGANAIEIIEGAYLSSFGWDRRDADEDGFADAYEAATPGLTPGSPDYGQYPHDYDGDGLSDGMEIELGLNPLAADSDGDGVGDWLEWVVAQAIPGKAVYERWDDLRLDHPSSLYRHERFLHGPPGRPRLLDALESQRNAGDNFAARLRAFVVAPVSGAYRFYVCSDDGSMLWLGSRAGPDQARCIASVPTPGHTGWAEWRKYPEQESAPIHLEAGEHYYLEAVHAENERDDFVRVGWRIPGTDAIEVIGGEHLHPFFIDPKDRDQDGLDDAWERANGLDPRAPEFGAQPYDFDGDGLYNADEFAIGADPLAPETGGRAWPVQGYFVAEKWNGLEGNEWWMASGAAAPWTRPPDEVTYLRGTHLPANRDDNFAVRIRGLLTAPADGDYEFLLASDDGSILLLGLDGRAQTRRRIAEVPHYTRPRDWDRYPQQRSDLIPLEQGKAYYFEVFMKDGRHYDNLDVAWIRPDRDRPEIIGYEFMRTYAGEWMDPGDADDDGLDDAWELSRGLDPTTPDIGISPGDFDNDGLSDYEEIHVYGTDPLNADTDGDGLPDGLEVAILQTSPLAADTDGDGQPDAVTVDRRVGAEALETAAFAGYDWRPEGAGLVIESTRYLTDPTAVFAVEVPIGGCYVVRVDASNFRAAPDAPLPPEGYRFRLEVEVNGNFRGEIALPIVDRLGGATQPGFVITPWLMPGSHTVTVRWTQDWDDRFPDSEFETTLRLDAVALLQIDGTDADANGIDDWAEATLSPYEDSDGDGLINLLEYALGTNPTLADTDGDGMSDGFEVLHAHSDPLTPDFDGTRSVVLEVAGSEGWGASGEWDVVGASLRNLSGGGAARYSVFLPDAGVFALEVDLGVRFAGLHPVPMRITLRCDGRDVSTATVMLSPDVRTSALFMLPGLAAGTHDLEIVWSHRLHGNYTLRIHGLRVLALGGLDRDGNGIADWLDARRERMLAMQPPATSLTSPVCVEGESAAAESLLLLADAEAIPVLPCVGDGWYANVPLSPDAPVELTVLADGGWVSAETQVQWTPWNLFGHDDDALSIRRGDALLLAAHPAGDSSGQVEIWIPGVTNWVGAASESFAVTFDQAGIYDVAARYDGGGGVMETSRTVEVVFAAFPGDVYAQVGAVRDWVCPDIPPDPVVIEYDAWLTLRAAPRPGGGSDLELSTPDESPRGVLARLGESGPILDAARVHGLVANASVHGWVDTVQTHADGMRTVANRIRLNHVPPDLRIELTIFVGGVTFDDGTLQRVVTAADFDANGEYRYSILMDAGVTTSECHSGEIYAGDTYIGRI